MTPNDELLARTLRHIIENPREWDQESWAHRWEDEDKLGRDVCGTADGRVDITPPAELADATSGSAG